MKYYYRRHLPHIIVKDSIYFITSRLAGSLPKEITDTLRQQYLKELQKIASYRNPGTKSQKYYELKLSYFYKYENFLHHYSSGPTWLGIDEIAKIVYDSILFRDKKIYDLYAFTIMFNHIHLIIKPITDANGFLLYNKRSEMKIGRKVPTEYILGDIMESLKRFTATRCNKVLSKKGTFWQHENYDHIVRHYKELLRIINYTLENPVKAGKVNSFEEYKWNYYNPQLL